ncbi:thiol reductant ABC exporter subunit CydC [Halorhodospira halophila]|uniref:thiol reductant ABC exporter subunit CydC n=1 Tax=Halorhodospira halophila TaxID=1053 RepID=UPI001911D5B1
MRELKPFLRDLRRERGRLVLGTLLLIVSLAASIGLMGLSGWFITATAVAGLTGAYLDIYRPSAGIRFFALARSISRYFERLVHHDAVLRTLARLRGWLFRTLAPLPLARVGRLRRSDLLNRMTADVEALDNLYLRIVGPSLAAVVTLAATVTVLVLLAGPAGLAVGAVLLAGGLVLPLWAWRRGSPHGEAVDRHLPALRGAGVDAVQGLAELRACGAVARHEQRLMAAADGLAAARSRAARLTGAGEGAVGLLAHGALLAALVAGIPLYHAGTISGPLLALVALAALAAGEALTTLPGAWQHLGRTRAAARRLLEHADAAPDTAAPPSEGPPRQALGLALEGVTFRHEAHLPPVLRDCSLALAPGETVVIHGPSGCGKSTLLDLAAGLTRPESGTVILGGVPVAQLPEAERFARITYLTQRTELFADSVAGNLRIADPHADEARMWRALHTAGLEERVRAAPRGLDEWIGEGGGRLSGGEARRLALARLVLVDAPVVLLDEPFRGLDDATATQVARRLAPWLAERTALIISHDPESVPAHDRRVPFLELVTPGGE